MATLALGRKLGLVETISVSSELTGKRNKQSFSYLFVLDFESTCWDKDDKNKGLPEIIEFSVVVFDISQDKIVEEYQQYVMPYEYSKLSDFCLNFTGITQKQVDEGVPLQTCLMMFTNWSKNLSLKYNFTFPSEYNTHYKKKSVFVTWSDWDLDNCLKNECKRKMIDKPDMFNMWIDLRAVYKEWYHRRPKNLKGALAEVGLEFEGKEHSGLHDARNTSFLASRMISDGVVLKITKSLT